MTNDIDEVVEMHRREFIKHWPAMLRIARNAAELDNACLCGHGADRHNNAARCDMCECKEYQG